MVDINRETTKIMLENTSCDFLVHKGSYDRLYHVLKNKSIGWRDFASFSDGFPLIPLHDDTIIIFDKNNLVEKNHHFLKINYDMDFLKQNKDILKHLMENKSEDDLLKEIFKSATEDEKKLKIVLKSATVEEKKAIYAELNRLQQAKKSAESGDSSHRWVIF